MSNPSPVLTQKRKRGRPSKAQKYAEYLLANPELVAKQKAEFHLRESAPALLASLKDITNMFAHLWKTVAKDLPNETLDEARKTIAEAEKFNT